MKICLNPNCQKEFKPGNYGDRQLVCHWKRCKKWYKAYWSLQERIPRGISDGDFGRIMSSLSDDKIKYALFATARMTGMRRNEILGLRWSDIFRCGQIMDSFVLGHQWYERGDIREFMPTKLRTHRMVHIGSPLKDILYDLFNSSDDDVERIFPFGGSTVYKWFIKAQKCLGITNKETKYPYRFHDIRHAFATQVVKAEDPFLAQHLLGHAKPEGSLIYSKMRVDNPEERVLCLMDNAPWLDA